MNILPKVDTVPDADINVDADAEEGLIFYDP